MVVDVSRLGAVHLEGPETLHRQRHTSPSAEGHGEASDEAVTGDLEEGQGDFLDHFIALIVWAQDQHPLSKALVRSSTLSSQARAAASRTAFFMSGKDRFTFASQT